MQTVFTPRERGAHEARVAVTPETVERLLEDGFDVLVEPGAGARAHFADVAYVEAGARMARDLESAWASDVVVKVQAPGEDPSLASGHEARAMREGALLVALCSGEGATHSLRMLRERRVNVWAMERLPRITRAQPMDALSSQASIAGYKAALLSATHLDKHFPLMMTAAGTIHPARVVVMGAGVAGLSAVATCKRLGATVEVSDIREEVAEQVESLGARFIELPMKESGAGEGGYAKAMSEDFLRRQRRIVAERLTHADAVITTALVPGSPAPKLIDASTVDRMRPGAVIVDLAAPAGGNCELTLCGETVVTRGGVVVVGPPNLAATLPRDASLMYARNIAAVLEHVSRAGQVSLDPEDEITGPALVIHEGAVRDRRIAEVLEEARR